jgi:hypothetical protein
MAAKTVERRYRCSPGRLYAAALRTVTEMGYSIINSDATSGTLSFRTGMSMRSWQGQEMTATIFDDEGIAKIVVGGRRATHGSQLQVGDLGEARTIALKLLGRLDVAVQSMPEPAAAAASQSMTDELERLTRLHEQGALTSEEFDAAKRKLLA